MPHPLDEMRSSMKVLVFGAGRMGAIRVEDLASDARVSEVLVTNRNEQRAKDLASQFGATVVPWEKATGPMADAVVVAVGTDAHDAVLSNVVPQGIPVLCEKPIAKTLEATEAAIALAQSSGSPLQIGFQRRFDESIRSVHSTIQTGAIGTVYSLTMTAHDHTPSAREFIAGSGGIFRDMHVHDFDLVRWL
ncbi:MAG: Gfo/Idh/MocA family oxidoreductase, partial [Microbacteriaceae bacterium]|nr:Gfo/Idh/MocA family oxidoreductase [Microbacteriaceae bacterium]